MYGRVTGVYRRVTGVYGSVTEVYRRVMEVYWLNTDNTPTSPNHIFSVLVGYQRYGRLQVEASSGYYVGLLIMLCLPAYRSPLSMPTTQSSPK